MSLKPIILWGHKTGPNSWKVALVLEELEIPYEHKFLELAEMKKEEYEALNPNGRVPTIEDPNTGMIVWEVIWRMYRYICETYDKSHKLSPQDPKVMWLARSWRDFQMSGQGPYFGQYSWFINYHPENLPSVKDRYQKEIMRIVGVMEKQLSETEYLAGDEMTYADLMWLPYFIVAFRVGGVEWEREFPSWWRWWEKVKGRPAVERVWGEWMRLRGSVGK